MDTTITIYLAAVIVGAILIRGLRLLDTPATIVAAIMALSLLMAGGWSWLTPALAFLITSSIWTHWPGASKSEDSTRDYKQVLANGLVPMLAAALFLITGYPSLAPVIVGCFAAAAADTWATEWGGKFGGRPLDLHTFKFVNSGQSGAISLIGTIASAVGATFVTTISAFAGMIHWEVVVAVSLAGTVGSLIDSLAGAWLQGLWIDDSGQILETPPEDIKRPPPRGIQWVNNDIVNLITTLAGGLLAFWWTAT